MATVRLLRGALPATEIEVGRLADGQVEVVGFASGTCPALVDDAGMVVAGGKFEDPGQRLVLGQIGGDGQTVVRGYEPRGDTVGTFAAGGAVYTGLGIDSRQVGRTEPPSPIGAACLLLVFVAPEESNRTPPDAVAVAGAAAGIAAGAVGIGLTETIKEAWRGATRPRPDSPCQVCTPSDPGLT